jgi:hypothetical protein
MSMLIGAGWLLNYAPLGSGLIGRVAYHKAYNAIRVRDSGRVVVESIGAGLGAAALMLFAVIAKQHESLWPQLAIVLVFFIAWAWWVASFRRPASISGALAGAFVLKWLDMTVWVLRYLLIFMLIGRSPTLTQAVAIATVSQIATLVPFIGNGLGIREWLVGLTASSLPAWFVGASGDDGITMQTGLSAEVLNRVCELIAASAAGIPCSVLLARRIATGASNTSHAQTLENPVEH